MQHVFEDLAVWEELHQRAGLMFGGRTDILHRRNRDFLSRGELHRLNLPIDNLALLKIQAVSPAVTVDREAQPRGQCVHAGHTDAMQAAGDLVAVLIEFAAGMQFSQRDFGRAALRLMFVVELDLVRNAAPVIQHRDGFIVVDGDHDVLRETGEDFINRVVYHFVDKLMQP